MTDSFNRNCTMLFDPKEMKIKIDWLEMKSTPSWRRECIALYIHELVHVFEWLFVYHKDVEKWNSVSYETSEYYPNKIQNFFLKILSVNH